MIHFNIMKVFFTLFLSWFVVGSSTLHIDADNKDAPNIPIQENHISIFISNKALRSNTLAMSKRNTPTSQFLDTQKSIVLIRGGKRRKKGKFMLNFGLHSSHAGHINPYSFHDRSQNLSTHPRLKKNYNRFRILPSDKSNAITSSHDDMDEQFSLKVDVASAGRLFILFFSCVGSTMNAFFGTLRLLAPL